MIFNISYDIRIKNDVTITNCHADLRKELVRRMFLFDTFQI